MKGLYIHVPFCRKRCPYCAFTAAVPADDAVTGAYVDALLHELAPHEGVSFDTVYIGGGTPSVLAPHLLERLLAGVLNTIDYTGAEFTIEANPESASEDFFNILQHAPVSRISMGAQSFDDDTLAVLGRIHTSADVFAAVDRASRILPQADICLDMIYDIPGAPEHATRKTLDAMLDLSPEHVSAYAYSFDTGHLAGAGQDDAESEMDMVSRRLIDAGYEWYEVSNFAKPGHESIHNTGYWQMADYIGIGASAHSMTTTPTGRIRWENTADIASYIEDPANGRIMHDIDTEESIKETLCFGLRTTAGVDTRRLSEHHGTIDRNTMQKLETLTNEGLITWNDHHVTTTARGRELLDSVMSYLW